VYVLSNPTMPGYVKIGFTDKTPEERAIQLSRSTGVILPFKVEWAFHCYNAEALEKEMKKAKPAVNKNVSLKRTTESNVNKFMTFIFNFLIYLNIQPRIGGTKPPRKFPLNYKLSPYPYILYDIKYQCFFTRIEALACTNRYLGRRPVENS